jgi:hypothetical protein
MKGIEGNSNRDCGNPRKAAEIARKAVDAYAKAHTAWTTGVKASLEQKRERPCDTFDGTRSEEHMKSAQELAKMKKEHDPAATNQTK